MIDLCLALIIFKHGYSFTFQIAARSVEHIKHVNKGLENKIIELQQKLDEKVVLHMD